MRVALKVSVIHNHSMSETNRQHTAAAPRKKRKFVFTIGSMMVIAVVVAFTGLLLGRMVVASRSEASASVGYFAIAAALAPSAALVGAGTAFRILHWIQR